MTIGSTADVISVLKSLLDYFSQSKTYTSTSYTGTVFSVIPEVGEFGPTGAVDIKMALDTQPADGSSSIKTFTFFKPSLTVGLHGTLVVQSATSPGDYEVLVSFTLS